MHFLKGGSSPLLSLFFYRRKKFILPTRGRTFGCQVAFAMEKGGVLDMPLVRPSKVFWGPRGVLSIFFAPKNGEKSEKKLPWWILSGLRIQKTYKNENSRKGMWVGIEDGIGLLAWLLQEVASIHGWQSREAHAGCPNSVYIFYIPTHLPLCHLESRFMYHTVFFGYFLIDMFLLNVL